MVYAMSSVRHTPIWIAGLGNVLMKDDGVGAVAAMMLAENPPEGAFVSEVGTAILSYADHLSSAEDILVIDALRGGKEPGTVSLFTMDELELSVEWRTAHDLSFADALQLFRGGRPARVKVLGIEPGEIDYGMELSQAVKDALPAVVDAVRKVVAEWREDSSH